ncbi:MAG: penicillin-binding protein [Propionibacteriaceae bacterium]|nr:penicillin-binding protein [Propionibacteriaceae bacterium]
MANPTGSSSRQPPAKKPTGSGSTKKPTGSTTAGSKRPPAAKGASGAKGAKGAKGPQGPKGPKGPKGPQGTAAGRPKRSWWRRVLLAGLITGLACLILGLTGIFVAYRMIDFPDPNREFTTEKTQVYYRDGQTVLGSFAEQNRTSLAYADMPQTIKDAVVAAENRDFWTDPGISFKGILRSALNIVRGQPLQSGSTITQQYIKLLYLTSDQTATRKLKELLLAVKMSRNLAKENILEGYLNIIYFGRGAYGLQAAARAYFNIDAADLSLTQSAALVAIFNNPGNLDPHISELAAERLLARYRYVLDGMAAMGAISPEQHLEASAALPEFPDVPINQRFGGPTGFLLKMVEAELADAGLDSSLVSGGGLRIVTTFDAQAQAAAVTAAQTWSNKSATEARTPQDPSQLHAALASVEVGTGDVLALYGGPDYLESSWNYATRPRMAASTFKTYALAAGLRNGFTLSSRLNGNSFTPTGDSVPVRNEFNHQYGTVSLAKAIADSINTAFVDLTQRMPDGAAEVAQAANDAGVPTNSTWSVTNRIALGQSEVSPLEQATGYATFANGGVYVAPHVVREVYDSSGALIYRAQPETRQAFTTELADTVNYALRGVVEEGTGAKVQNLGYPIAGKTGTAEMDDQVVSSWFVGYTRQVSTAVLYVAGADGISSLDPYARKGDSTFFGGTYPALTWLDYMRVAQSGRERLEFEKPRDLGPTVTPQPTPEPSPADQPTTPTVEPSPSPTEPTPGPDPSPTAPEPSPTAPGPEPSPSPT